MQNLEIQPKPLDVLKDELREEFQKFKNSSLVQIFFYIYYLTLAVTSIVCTCKFYSSSSFNALSKSYNSLYGEFQATDLLEHLDEPCAEIMAGIITIPTAFLILTGFSLFNLLFTCGKFPILMFSAMGTVFTGGFAILSAFYRCEDLGDKIGQSVSENLPRNAWPYHAAIAGVFLLSLMMENCWRLSLAKDWDKKKEEEERRKNDREPLIESF